jgi:hypothetical protein
MFNALLDATASRDLQSAPSTSIAGGGTRDQPSFTTRERDREELDRYEAVYREGGPVAQLIDTRAYMIHGVGTEFVTEAEDQTAPVPWSDEPVTVAEWLDHALPHRDNLLVQLARDAYIYGDWLTETVGDGRAFDRIVTINPKTMEPTYDDKGTIDEWRQYIQRGPRKDMEAPNSPFSPDEIGHGALFTIGRDPLGISLVGRIMDQVERFEQNQAAIAEALDKHAFRRWHVQVQASVDDQELRRIRQRFHQVSDYRELTTGRDIEIEPLDEGGIGESITDITENDLMGLAAAIGVPEEMAGLGRGSTEATAKVRLQAFERTGRGEQRDMAAQFEREVLRDIVAEYSPFPDDIDFSMTYGDIVSDQAAIAEWLRDFKASYTNNEIRAKLDDGPVPEDADIAGDESPVSDDQEGPGGGGLFDGLSGDSGNGHRAASEAAQLTPWEQAYQSLLDRSWQAEPDRGLFEFDPEEVPEFVMDNLRDAIDQSLFSDFENIPDQARMAVRAALLDSLDQRHGWSIRSIMDNLAENIPGDVSEQYLETVARSETQHLVSTAAEESYRDRLDMDEAEFRWSGMPFDPDRSTEACQWIERQIEQAGGGVSMDRLKELIQEAPEHDPDLDDDMAREWSPHPQCTHRPVRVVD